MLEETEMKDWITKAVLLFLIFVAFISRLSGQAAPVPVMPMPSSVQFGSGAFSIGSSLHFAVKGEDDGRIARAVERFRRNLFARTGIPVRDTGDASSPAFVVTCAAVGEKVQTLEEDESYRLIVTSADVHLDAPNPLGILHGLQTFLQLVRIGPDGFVVPAIAIEDRPRFPWRGILIDVSRHFMPVDVVKRNLDGMEALKLNVLHWHLSDDQGFRVESRRFPKFQELASEGMYYTRQEIRDLIQYARDRGIRVVPEFDMPGHSTSWFAAYPELASGPGPYPIEHKWGIFDPAMDPSRDETYHFLDRFIGEMAQLFPDRYLHIGGDEVNGKQWDRNNHIHEFMLKRGIKDNHALQAYFNQRLQAIVSKHGKVMTGWDEILQPTLPNQAVIQSWRGQASLADAVRRGYRGLLSYGYYLDLMQPASLHYSVDPLGGDAAALTAEEQQRILGGEACMWAEFVTPANIDARIWPRAAAVAERLWSQANVTDAASMYSRLEGVSQHLEFLGLAHRRAHRMMLERLSGGSDVRALQVLVQVLEPVKEYGREEARMYDSLTPLNRLVDTVPPESDTARQFGGMVESWLGHSSASGDLDAMKKWLTLWQNNDQQLEPILQRNALLKEIVPLSQSLQTVAAAGLQALDYLGEGGRAPANWREQQLTMLKQASKPQAELMNMVVPAVERLVTATIPE
jgi:hexosaminidase